MIVLKRLPYPLLSPEEDEREGYVPNVVYSCGSLILGERLLIPYAVSDYASGFAWDESGGAAGGDGGGVSGRSLRVLNGRPAA